MKKSILIIALIIALFTSACAPKEAEITQGESVKYDISVVDSYMETVKKDAENISDYLENEAMTQIDMNEKSKELYELWKEALNYLVVELEHNFTKEEFEIFIDEQDLWTEETERAIEEAGKGYEGGSVYPLIANSEGARLTEERVYELYGLLKEAVTES